LFEEKEYRYKASFKRRGDTRDAVRELAKLIGKTSRRSGGASRGHDARQKCVVKMQYSTSLEAHKVQLEHYLSREGTDIDGGAARLFGTDGETYRENMTGKNFRVFLSPQKADVDLRTLAQRFITNLEKQTGYRLFWQGACHYNTAHPHAHLVINGVDALGRDIKFPRDVVRTFMRETARDLCTAQLGRRTLEELKIEKEQELASPRLTRLDKRIGELCAGSKRVRLEYAGREQERILARLEHLRKLNVCSYENGGYRLHKDWEENLMANGRYNTFLKARDTLHYTAPSQLKLYTGAAGEVSGKVTKIYRLEEDASDNHAVVVEALDGKAYFVPLFKKPELQEGKTKTNLHEGELVTLKTYGTQQGRLTPCIFKQDAGRAKGMVKKNGYEGKLAEEIMAGKSAARKARDGKKE
jgi:hypothetical protein